MECDECKSKNIELIEELKYLKIDTYFYKDYYEATRLTFKCLDCGFEFTEDI